MESSRYYEDRNWKGTPSSSRRTQVTQTIKDDLSNYSFKEICVIMYGFLCIKDIYRRVRCIICRKRTYTEYPKAIVTHFNSEHSDIMSESYNHVVRLLRSKVNQMTYWRYPNGKGNIRKINYRDRSTIYVICRKIVKDVMPYLITETMIKLPDLEDMLEVIVKDTAENRTDELLFNCVRNMSSDIKEQLIEKVRDKKFSLQYEVTEDYELLINIRFLNENRVVEHFLSYTKLSTTATGLDIFNCITTRLGEHMLCWENCVSLCVAGVSVMCDRIGEFYCKLNESCPTIEYTKCFTFRDEILMERMPMELEQVLDSVAEMVRYIVSSRVGLKVLKALCEVVDPYYETMIIHTDYWMFNSELLAKFYEHRNDLADIFGDKKPAFAVLLKDKEWCSKLAYLVDIFDCLYEILLPGSEENDHIIRWEILLHLAIEEIGSWESDIKNNDFQMFPSLSDTDMRNIYPLVLKHLKILQEILPRYLPTFDTREYRWICDPFKVRAQSVSVFLRNEATELASLQSDFVRKQLFEKTSLPVFWSSVKSVCPHLANIALHMLLHFSSARLLDREHSEMLNIKYKSVLNPIIVEDELRVRVSWILPRVHLLCWKWECNGATMIDAD
nr:PREDICTED: SCAN domain-containing protein 3-like [Megachile rotundata]